VISDLVRSLLENGVHFGHQTSRWNPKMKKFIFGQKDGIYIIDLRKTEELLIKAVEYIKDQAAQGKQVLFVGTKRQAQNIIAQEAKRCGMYYINQRWLGGTLTNFNTIRKSINRLKELKGMEEKGTFDLLSKKEKSQLTKEMQRLKKNLGGIENMEDTPDVLFIIDAVMEHIAVQEAKKLSIPIVAVTDTNCDPDLIDYSIPSNDDAIKSIKLITSIITDAVIEGKKSRTKASGSSKSESKGKEAKKSKKTLVKKPKKKEKTTEKKAKIRKPNA